VWDRETDEPVHAAIVWQDRRTEAICNELRRTSLDAFTSRTGLVIDPYFSATKLMWLLENVPGLRWRAESGELAFGTVDSWVAWKLTGGEAHVTDESNASRTLLFNIFERRWSEALLSRTRVPAAMLPEVKDTRCHFGVTRGVGSLPDGIPILALCGDQQASLFGQALTHPGDWKATYGTGGFLMAVTGKAVRTAEALTSIAWTVDGQPTYYLEAAVFVCGSALQWLRDGVGLFRNYGELATLLERGKGWASDLYCVPAFTGFGTPFWDAGARGLLIGITRGTSAADLCAATLEGIAFEMNAAFRAMVAVTPFRRLLTDGGCTQSPRLMQFQADLLQRPVEVSSRQEGTAFGAAFLAGLEAGVWSGLDELAAVAPQTTVYQPAMEEKIALRLSNRWKEAAGRALKWAQ
jgi:glycerol kinase